MRPNHSVPADPSQLIVGQFVQVRLVDDTLRSRLKKWRSRISRTGACRTGKRAWVEIHDLVEIEVHNHTVITVPAPASPLMEQRQEPKTRVFKAKNRGSFTLNGLFTGEAKIIIKRNVHGHKNKVAKLVKVRGNRTGQLKVRLRDN